ncbi:MAG: hypothetical protein ACOCRX_11245, partial [Candidatus Woesearchaeota archaeon]
MKYKTLIICFLVIAVTSKVFSQVTIGEVKKSEEKDSIISKPEPYDSLQRFERQQKDVEYKKYIGLDFYLTPLPSSDIGDRYYKLIDVLYGNKSNDFQEYVKEYEYKNIYDSEIYSKEIKSDLDIFNYQGSAPIFVFRDKENKDTLYTTFPKRFFLVPFIQKTKQQYKNKPLICRCGIHFKARNVIENEIVDVSDESKWFFKDIKLFKVKDIKPNKDDQSEQYVLQKHINPIRKDEDEYILYYILENKEGETITLQNLGKENEFSNVKNSYYGYHFFTEQEYEQKQRKERLEEKKLKAEQKRNEKLKRQNEKAKQEKHRTECIEKYGKNLGELIAQGKVKIGMTQSMCKTAWGNPLWK